MTYAFRSTTLAFLVVLLCAFAPQEGQGTPSSDGRLTVAVAERPPFASQGDDGSWQGLSVNVWRTSAEELELSYRFVEAEGGELLQGVAEGRFDVALPIYADAEEAERIDFTFPHYTATLGVAEKRAGLALQTLRNLVSTRLLGIVASLSVLLFVVGAIIWFLERRSNPEQFNSSPVKGLGDGFWWAGVTLTTIGYGDKAPATLAGRAVAMLWMLVGLAVSAALTASVVAATEIPSADADRLADLGDVRVGIVDGSGVSTFIEFSGGGEPQPFADAEEGLRALKEGELDLFVHPAPQLKAARENSPLDLKIAETDADPVPVTFAVAKGSDLAPELEAAILRRITDPSWGANMERYIPD